MSMLKPVRLAILSLSVATTVAACGTGHSDEASATLSSGNADVAQQPLREKPAASQELTLTFKCDALTDYTAIDEIKPVVYRHKDDSGAFKFSVENFLMICADRVKATAAFDAPARRLSVDMRPEGLKHCLCKYELDPIAIGVPNDARVSIEDYLLSLSKTETDTHKVMFEAKIGAIPYKELTLPRPE